MSESVRLTDRMIAGLSAREKVYDVWDSEIKGFVIRIFPTGIKSFRYSYRINGKRQTLTLGKFPTLTTAQARDMVRQQVAQVIRGVDVQSEKKAARETFQGVPTLQAFIDEEYEAWRVAHRKDARRSINRLKRQFHDLLNKPLNQITHVVLQRWQTQRINEGVAHGTINRDIAELRACLTHAVNVEVLEASPLVKLDDLQTDDTGRVRWLSSDEEDRLRKVLAGRDALAKQQRTHANQLRLKNGHATLPEITGWAFCDHLTPMVIVSFLTGLRRGELFGLQWRDVDLAQGHIVVRGKTSKSKNTRFVPLCDEAIHVLQLWKKQTDSDGYVFKSVDGKPFTDVKKSWGAVLKEAGIKDFVWHDLRHDFGSKLAMSGVDLYTIMSLMGHKDIKTTMIYAHLSPSHKAKAVSSLGRKLNQEPDQGS